MDEVARMSMGLITEYRCGSCNDLVLDNITHCPKCNHYLGEVVSLPTTVPETTDKYEPDEGDFLFLFLVFVILPIIVLNSGLSLEFSIVTIFFGLAFALFVALTGRLRALILSFPVDEDEEMSIFKATDGSLKIKKKKGL
jgi:hypothetical protein